MEMRIDYAENFVICTLLYSGMQQAETWNWCRIACIKQITLIEVYERCTGTVLGEYAATAVEKQTRSER